MSEESKKQSRKWQLTINNPVEHGYTHELIIGLLRKLGVTYFCMADEIGGETHTYHTHICIYRESPLRFGTLKKMFPVAHIEQAYGTMADNRNYVLKQGKWQDTEKAETSVEGTFYEEGTMPSPASERSPSKGRILELIKDGATDSEIINSDPSTIYHIKDFGSIRQTVLSEKYASECRAVTVSYIYGKTGVGKTRSIYEKYGAVDICRINSYRSSSGALFDAYQGQPVLVLDEYASQIPIEELLMYLDRYPVRLRARYYDRIACYEQVYILSNLSLKEQYESVQEERPDQFQALLRRIQNVVHLTMTSEGEMKIIVEKGEWNLYHDSEHNKN